MSRLTPVEVAARAFGSQYKLAKALGVPDRTISHWKRSKDRKGCDGDIPRTYLRKVLTIARTKGLDLTADDLIFGREVQEAAG